MENSQVKTNGDAGSVEAWQKSVLKPVEWLVPSELDEILKLQLRPRVEPSSLVGSRFLSVSEFLEELTEKTDPVQPLVDLIQAANGCTGSVFSVSSSRNSD